jgi:hypothetical protein
MIQFALYQPIVQEILAIIVDSNIYRQEIFPGDSDLYKLIKKNPRSMAGDFFK